MRRIMGLYAAHIFPRLMDWILRSDRYDKYRKATLATARGRVLEIGFGTGLNLPHYPSGVVSLTALDPKDMLPEKVRERIAAARFPVEIAHASAERLPFPDAHFDSVVSTWTLCTIPDVNAALREIARVLTPDGGLLFLEHGLSRDPRWVPWQHRLDPLQQLVACGCHLDRPIDRLIEQAGLRLTSLERFVMEDSPRIIGEMYRGSAMRN